MKKKCAYLLMLFSISSCNVQKINNGKKHTAKDYFRWGILGILEGERDKKEQEIYRTKDQ